MGYRYVISNDKKKILYVDGTKLYGHSMSQILPCDEIEMWHGLPDFHMNKLEEFLYTPDDNDIDYFVEVDIKYPDNVNNKTKKFPSSLEKKM